MARRKHAGRRTLQVEAWELEMIAKVASAFRTAQKEDLKAELARRLCQLKARKPAGIRDWKRYLAKFLYNKASNIIRSWRMREIKEQPYDVSDEIDFNNDALNWLACVGPDRETALDFERIWQNIDPELRRFWQVLLEEGGNQTSVAKRLNKHRNTIRLWIKNIRALLKRQWDQS